MKCVIGFTVLAICAMQMISAIPVRNGMVFYQSQPDYYNAHRAFVMQYASQPLRSHRRQGQAAGVSAFASGKKIAAGTYLKQTEQLEDEEQYYPDGGVQSVAEAYPETEADEVDPNEDEEQTFVKVPSQKNPNDVVPLADELPEESPEEPSHIVPTGNRKTPVQSDEEDEEDYPVRTRNRGAPGGTYFPVTFGSTNGGAIAIANSYSTGKGGSASSRATAYGSPSKAKKRIA